MCWAKGEGLICKFDSLEKMNDDLVNNINEVVGENIFDYLGDWSLEDLIHRI